jgi:hypothetical protein
MFDCSNQGAMSQQVLSVPDFVTEMSIQNAISLRRFSLRPNQIQFQITDGSQKPIRLNMSSNKSKKSQKQKAKNGLDKLASFSYPKSGASPSKTSAESSGAATGRLHTKSVLNRSKVLSKKKDPTESAPAAAGPSTSPSRKGGSKSDRGSISPTDRVKSTIQTLIKSTPTGKGKGKDTQPVSDRRLPTEDELEIIVQNFAALVIAMDGARTSIVRICQTDPSRNPYETIEELTLRIHQLHQDLILREKEVTARFGLESYHSLYEEIQNDLPSDEGGFQLSQDFLRWFKTSTSIDNFFHNSISHADKLTLLMHGVSELSDEFEVYVPHEDITYSAKDVDKRFSPIKTYSRLNLEPAIRKAFCLPPIPLAEMVDLWQELMDRRYQDFCDSRRTIRSTLNFLQRRHGSSLKSIPNFEQDLQELQVDINQWGIELNSLTNSSPWIDKSVESKSDLVKLGHDRWNRRSFAFEVNDSVDKLKKILPEFLEHAHMVLLVERDMVFNAHASLEDRKNQMKVAEKWQLSDAGDHLASDTDLIGAESSNPLDE